jgi:hypothetical protein
VDELLWKSELKLGPVRQALHEFLNFSAAFEEPCYAIQNLYKFEIHETGFYLILYVNIL